MASTTPDNIFYPVGSDSATPQDNMAILAGSVQDALNRRQNYNFRWADQAARTSQTGMRVGDTGYQIDIRTNFFYDGTQWLPEGQTEYQIIPSATAGTVSAIGTVTGSGFASISLNNVFSPAFSDYRIWISTYGSVAQNNSIRFRSAGTDNSTTNYFSIRTRGTQGAATPVTTNTSAGTTWDIFGAGANISIVNDIELIIRRPNLAVYTRGSGRVDQTTPSGFAANDGHTLFSGLQTQSLAFDGFTVSTAAGNWAGFTLKIFGLRD